MNKRGEEYVEAAIVLPLVILTVLSMIMIAVFLFGLQERQTEAHMTLMREAAAADDIFAVKRSGASSSAFIRGTYGRNVSESHSYRAYALSQADAVMLGKLIS